MFVWRPDVLRAARYFLPRGVCSLTTLFPFAANSHFFCKYFELFQSECGWFPLLTTSLRGKGVSSRVLWLLAEEHELQIWWEETLPALPVHLQAPGSAWLQLHWRKCTFLHIIYWIKTEPGGSSSWEKSASRELKRVVAGSLTLNKPIIYKSVVYMSILLSI